MTTHPGTNRRALPPPPRVPTASRIAARYATVAVALVLGTLIVFAPMITIPLLLIGALASGRFDRPIDRVAEPPARQGRRAGGTNWRLAGSIGGLGALALLTAPILPEGVATIYAAVGLGGFVVLRLLTAAVGLDPLAAPLLFDDEPEAGDGALSARPAAA